MRELPDLVVPFKRETYERVVREFAKFAGVDISSSPRSGTQSQIVAQRTGFPLARE